MTRFRDYQAFNDGTVTVQRPNHGTRLDREVALRSLPSLRISSLEASGAVAGCRFGAEPNLLGPSRSLGKGHDEAVDL